MSDIKTKSPEPLRGPERLEWARINLEEAVARMVKHPGESVYRAAVVARWCELDVLRGGMERLEQARAASAVSGRPEKPMPTPLTSPVRG